MDNERFCGYQGKYRAAGAAKKECETRCQVWLAGKARKAATGKERWQLNNNASKGKRSHCYIARAVSGGAGTSTSTTT